MARRDDIVTAFRQSIVLEASGRRTVSTVDFAKKLAEYNHDWSLAEANLWIEHYQCMFTDVSTEEGELRTFQLFNPNNGGY